MIYTFFNFTNIGSEKLGSPRSTNPKTERDIVCFFRGFPVDFPGRIRVRCRTKMLSRLPNHLYFCHDFRTNCEIKFWTNSNAPKLLLNCKIVHSCTYFFFNNFNSQKIVCYPIEIGVWRGKCKVYVYTLGMVDKLDCQKGILQPLF